MMMGKANEKEARLVVRCVGLRPEVATVRPEVRELVTHSINKQVMILTRAVKWSLFAPRCHVHRSII